MEGGEAVTLMGADIAMEINRDATRCGRRDDTISLYPMPKRTTAQVKPANNGFFTIGYQSHSIESLIQSLNAHGVEILMDVRQNPVSRKAGFSKCRLQNAVVGAGIEYHHSPDLGTPPRIRKMYHNSGDLPAVLAAYEKHITANPEPLRLLAHIAATKTVCLLCLEKDHNMCHRGVIARKLCEMTKWKTIHLT
jgi:uncharacterized protein (DUF488 family)